MVLYCKIFSNNATICEEVTDVDVQEMLYTAVASSNPEHFGLTVTLRVILEVCETDDTFFVVKGKKGNNIRFINK